MFTIFMTFVGLVVFAITLLISKFDIKRAFKNFMACILVGVFVDVILFLMITGMTYWSL